MKPKYLFSFIILSLGISISIFLIANAFAQTSPSVSAGANIQYPVKELGNCQNESACRAYCDKPENTKDCVAFAEKNNLMSQEEIDIAKKFMASGSKGPGGCTTKETCEKYCNDMSRIDECVSFAEKNNLMPPKELEEAKKIQAAIAKGIKPPSCGSRSECDVYCSDPNHMEECITFAQEAGFMSDKELGESKKVLEAIKKGVKPPACRGKDECDVYCSDETHFEECIVFAQAAGFISPQDAEMARKTKGKGPGGCRGKEECDAFCQKEENMMNCAEFAVANGMMSQQDLEMMRKTGGKGPGGCRSKETCDAFCNNSDNQEICFNFAKENGMIPEGDLRRMEEGKQQFKEMLSQAPSTVLECLNSLVGSNQMEKYKSGTVMPPKEMGDKMGECFGKVMGPAQGGPGGGSGGPGQMGMPPFESMSSELKDCLKLTLGEDVIGRIQSGNLKNEEQAGLMEKAKSCFEKFMPSGQGGGIGGQIPGSQGVQGQPGEFRGGPGGCKSLEECKTYCESHQDECINFQSPQGGSTQPQEGFQPGGQQPTQPQPPYQPGTGTQQPRENLQPPSQYQMQQPINQPIDQQPPSNTLPPPSSPPPSSSNNFQYFMSLMIEVFKPILGFF